MAASTFVDSVDQYLEALGVEDSRDVLIALLAVTVCITLWLRKPQQQQQHAIELAPLALRQPRQAPTPLEKNGDHAGYSHPKMTVQQMAKRAQLFHQFMNERRSLRFFSPDKVPLEVIMSCIAAAGTAPSGAHCQPWRFVVVSNPTAKHAIREAVEAQEQINYDKRMSRDWVDEVTPLISQLHSADGGVVKPYLDIAPYLIVVMKQNYGIGPNGERIEHRYPVESVGLAVGLLLAALHNANLVTLTSTPLGCGQQICDILQRPSNEKVFLLLPVGLPAAKAMVPFRTPDTQRKPLRDIAVVV